MFSNSIESQLYLFFEILENIFLNLNVPLKVAIRGIKTFMKTFDRGGFVHCLTDGGE